MDCEKDSIPVILWVNNLKRWKRPELFMKLAEECRTLLPGVRFIMIGRPLLKGFYKRELERRFSKRLENLSYIGEKTLRETNEYIGRSTLYINTSNSFEGFGNSFIQAWMRGVPTLTMGFDPDGLIEENKLGFCCRSMTELIEKVKLLTSDRDSWLEMSLRCKQFARDNCNADVMIYKYENLFREILEHGCLRD
jgi:glycosyltransferase involved in cell wall biosynthesis